MPTRFLTRPRFCLTGLLFAVIGTVTAIALAESTAEGETVERLSLPVRDEIAPEPFDLEGRWVLTLPAGWQRKITLTRASDNTFHFQGVAQLLLSGVYELDASRGRLSLIEAEDPTQEVYEWEILNANTLQLVEQETPSGGNYVGATLSRDFDWNELVDNSAVELVGTRSHGWTSRKRADAE